MTNNIDRRNVATPEAKAAFVKRIESKLREKESEKGAFMKRCAVINDDIKDILEEAKGAGVPKASLKAVLKVRELEAKAKAKREELENDDLEIFVSIREALGDFADLPLGAAAVGKEDGKADPTTAAIVDAVMKDEASTGAAPEAEASLSEEDQAAEQKRRDDEFESADPAKKAATAKAPTIDPGAARRNRTAKKDVQATADKYAPRQVAF